MDSESGDTSIPTPVCPSEGNSRLEEISSHLQETCRALKCAQLVRYWLSSQYLTTSRQLRLFPYQRGDCHLTHIAPDPYGTSFMWWAHRCVGPRCIFRLHSTWPYSLRPSCQALSLKPNNNNKGLSKALIIKSKSGHIDMSSVLTSMGLPVYILYL